MNLFSSTNRREPRALGTPLRARAAAFTLIELLIVVAIIAILAAIAVPNLLNAQTRSKVARVKADMRTYAVAIESYRADYDDYPPLLIPPIQRLESVGTYLSTPIAYMTNGLIREPFNTGRGNVLYKDGDIVNGVVPDKREPIYGVITLPNDATIHPYLPVIQLLAPPPYNTYDLSRFETISARRWAIVSPGPDTLYAYDQFLVANPNDTTSALIGQVLTIAFEETGGVYDPTNGTISKGDIIRTGAGIFHDPR